jgi:hypothetical protein
MNNHEWLAERFQTEPRSSAGGRLPGARLAERSGASEKSSTPSSLPRGGNFDALLEVLDPVVVLRADEGAEAPSASRMVRGAQAVAGQALTLSRIVESAQLVLVIGVPGVVSWPPGGRPLSVMGLTVRSRKIVAIDILADPARLRQMDLATFKGSQ